MGEGIYKRKESRDGKHRQIYYKISKGKGKEDITQRKGEVKEYFLLYFDFTHEGLFLKADGNWSLSK